MANEVAPSDRPSPTNVDRHPILDRLLLRHPFTARYRAGTRNTASNADFGRRARSNSNG